MSFIGSPEVMAGRVVTVDLIANLPTGEPAGAERYVLENSSLYTSDGSSWTQVAGGGGGGSGTVTSVATGTGLTGGPITTTGTVALANTAVTPASYGSSSQVATFTVDQQGRLTAAASTSIAISGAAVSGDIAGNAANVTGTVAVAHGGTNSTTSLNNNRVMKSSGGAVVEAAAITAARSLVSDANGIPVATSTTTTEIGYVSGVTSALQTQLNAKQATGNYITSLTGDVTASGAGAAAATIAVGAVTDTQASLSVKPAIALVATTNLGLSGLADVIDGTSPSANTLVLATAQSTGSQNGPWLAQSGAWTRPTWYPAGGTTQAFQFISAFVRLGTVYQGSTWRMTTAGAITIDTTSTTWVVTPLAVNSSTTTGLGTMSTQNASSVAITGGNISPAVTLGTMLALTTGATFSSADVGGLYTVDTTSAGFSVTLPAASTITANRSWIFIDIGGVLEANNLTFVRNGSDQIGGVAGNFVYTTNFGGVRLVSDGVSKWLVI